MRNFKDIYELTKYMVSLLSNNTEVSVIAKKELVVPIMSDLLTRYNGNLELADIDEYEYDKEYFVSICYYNERLCVTVCQAYSYHKDAYLGDDGYILLHEDVNSKALIDLQNNEYTEMSGYEVFSIGNDSVEEDVEEECSNRNNDTDHTTEQKECKATPSVTAKTSYKVNGKDVSKEVYEEALRDMENTYVNDMRNHLLRYANFMDQLNKYMAHINWMVKSSEPTR